LSEEVSYLHEKLKHVVKLSSIKFHVTVHYSLKNARQNQIKLNYLVAIFVSLIAEMIYP
jgi:hypothetical protein